MDRDWQQRLEALQMSDMIYNDMRNLGMSFGSGYDMCRPGRKQGKSTPSEFHFASD